MEYFAQAQPALQRLLPELTDREREILNLLAQSHSNPDIAKTLALPENGPQLCFKYS